jgi:hypothetical protein
MKIHLVTLCLFAIALVFYAFMISGIAYALGGLGVLFEIAGWISLLDDDRIKRNKVKSD